MTDRSGWWTDDPRCTYPARHRSQGWYRLDPDGGFTCRFCTRDPVVVLPARPSAPIAPPGGDRPHPEGLTTDLLSSEAATALPIEPALRDVPSASPSASSLLARFWGLRGPRLPAHHLGPPPRDTRPSVGRHHRRCPYCGIDFRSANAAVLYCSKTHRVSDWRRRRRERVVP